MPKTTISDVKAFTFDSGTLVVDHGITVEQISVVESLPQPVTATRVKVDNDAIILALAQRPEGVTCTEARLKTGLKGANVRRSCNSKGFDAVLLNKRWHAGPKPNPELLAAIINNKTTQPLGRRLAVRDGRVYKSHRGWMWWPDRITPRGPFRTEDEARNDKKARIGDGRLHAV
jgi:hypothetical protein